MRTTSSEDILAKAVKDRIYAMPELSFEGYQTEERVRGYLLAHAASLPESFVLLPDSGSAKLLARAMGFLPVVELSELEKEYDYTIEFDDESEYVHFYFANVIDFENPAYVRFDPMYEVGKDIEREVKGETVLIPYEKVLRIVKRKPD